MKSSEQQTVVGARQVWVPPLGAVPASELASDGTVTIGRVVASCLYLDAPDGSVYCVDATRLEGWTCIGVATARGRVMVGDCFSSTVNNSRTGDIHAFTVEVVEVVAGTILNLREVGGTWETNEEASRMLSKPEQNGTRTSYAPARKGELYLLRSSGESSVNKIVVDATIGKFIGEDGIVYRMLSARVPIGRWERLDPVTPSCLTNATHDASTAFQASVDDHRWGTDASGKRYALVAQVLSVKAAGHRFDVPICTGDTEQVVADIIRSKLRSIDDAAGATKPEMVMGNGVATGGTEVTAQPGGALAQAPLVHTHDLVLDPATFARSDTRWEMGLTPADMRRLDDAIGRALEVKYAEESVTLGLVRLALDEMLISPTVVCAEGVNIAADTKHLRLLRQTIKEAAEKGTSTCSPWGKEQTITISRLEGHASVDVKAPSSQEKK